MYQSYFGLREEPFGVTPDPRFFYETEQHQEAVATAFCAIRQRRGFALLVGAPGLGKTSVLFTLVRFLKSRAQVAYLANPCYDAHTVLDAILAGFGLESAPSAAANQRLFYQYIVKAQQAGRTCVVIFDEAQDLSRDTLEAIRMLSNFETPSGKLVQIVLAGQPRLAETLCQPECEQIRQRISAISRLAPMDRRHSREYIAHRLDVAGGSLDLFSPAATEAIIAASGGVPRNINTLCFNSLMLAFAQERRQAGAGEVAEACRDLRIPFETPSAPAVPIAARPTPHAMEEPLPFAQTVGLLRPAWIAGGLTLLAAGIFVLTRF
jgi:general secretion pathway protein A